MTSNLLTGIFCCALIVYSNGKVMQKTLLIYNILVSEQIVSPWTNGSWTSWWARLCQDIIDTRIVFGSAHNFMHLYLNNHQQKWPRMLTFKRPPAHNAKGAPCDLQVFWNALLEFLCLKRWNGLSPVLYSLINNILQDQLFLFFIVDFLLKQDDDIL